MSQKEAREYLLECLRTEGAFWSFDDGSICRADDDQIIEKTLVHLDLDEIKIAFDLYGQKRVKRVWIERMIPQVDYLYSLNRFISWYYFKAKRPDQYIKSLATRQMNKLCKKV